MEFLIISENKMKIMLTAEEVLSYGIESEKTDYSDPIIRKAFWQILDRARDECGFKVSGDRLLIQYYPAKCGAEIFVTKLGKISLGMERSIRGADSVAMLTSKNMIYRFEDFTDLKRVCREINRGSPDSMGDVYFSEDGCYYLFFEDRSASGALSPFSVVGEFAEELPQIMELYIKEHSEEIASGDAFSKLSE